jgi:hypothetical protein
MTDLCCICMYMSDNKVCTRCNIHSHQECWEEYIRKSLENILNSKEYVSLNDV